MTCRSTDDRTDNNHSINLTGVNQELSRKWGLEGPWDLNFNDLLLFDTPTFQKPNSPLSQTTGDQLIETTHNQANFDRLLATRHDALPRKRCVKIPQKRALPQFYCSSKCRATIIR
jgi:hypothetical protein